MFTWVNQLRAIEMNEWYMWILSSLLAFYKTANEKRFWKTKSAYLPIVFMINFLFLKWMSIWWDWLNIQIQTCLQSPWYIVGDNFMWIYAVVSTTIHNLHIKINVYISNNLFWGWICSGNPLPYPGYPEKNFALQKQKIVAMQFIMMCILFWENQNLLNLTWGRGKIKQP